jgi:hypothetical protein
MGPLSGMAEGNIGIGDARDDTRERHTARWLSNGAQQRATPAHRKFSLVQGRGPTARFSVQSEKTRIEHKAPNDR